MTPYSGTIYNSDACKNSRFLLLGQREIFYIFSFCNSPSKLRRIFCSPPYQFLKDYTRFPVAANFNNLKRNKYDTQTLDLHIHHSCVTTGEVMCLPFFSEGPSHPVMLVRLTRESGWGLDYPPQTLLYKGPGRDSNTWIIWQEKLMPSLLWRHRKNKWSLLKNKNKKLIHLFCFEIN